MRPELTWQTEVCEIVYTSPVWGGGEVGALCVKGDCGGNVSHLTLPYLSLKELTLFVPSFDELL